MKAHADFEDRLPLYAAGQLTGTARAEIETHLAVCAQCQADLKLWTAVAEEIRTTDQVLAAPPALDSQALDQVRARSGLASAAVHAWQLLRVQARLVQAEMWPAAAVVMAMGVLVALISEQAEIIYFLAPLVAASTLAVLYGPEHDPALELSLATPTSPWKILLARLSVVSAFNLLLALAATLGLLLFIPAGLLGTLILGWLGPLAFLSALALLLSLWLGTGNAVAIAYGLWLLQYLPFKMLEVWMKSSAWVSALEVYQQFWRSPLLLLPLAALLIGMALWSASRPAFTPTRALG